MLKQGLGTTTTLSGVQDCGPTGLSMTALMQQQWRKLAGVGNWFEVCSSSGGLEKSGSSK